MAEPLDRPLSMMARFGSLAGSAVEVVFADVVDEVGRTDEFGVRLRTGVV